MQQDLGPIMPSRAAVYALATELQALSRLAVEFTVPGPHADLPRALRQIARMREELNVPLVLIISAAGQPTDG